MTNEASQNPLQQSKESRIKYSRTPNQQLSDEELTPMNNTNVSQRDSKSYRTQAASKSLLFSRLLNRLFPITLLCPCFTSASRRRALIYRRWKGQDW
jgi:hypothetical protein